MNAGDSTLDFNEGYEDRILLYGDMHTNHRLVSFAKSVLFKYIGLLIFLFQFELILNLFEFPY